jgi:hypothetical protein
MAAGGPGTLGTVRGYRGMPSTGLADTEGDRGLALQGLAGVGSSCLLETGVRKEPEASNWRTGSLDVLAAVPVALPREKEESQDMLSDETMRRLACFVI